jgi:hypothetical protein
MFALPLAIINATATQSPELRVIMSGSHVTALLVTESSRTLITNSSDRGATRSAIGYLARPWEPKITTLVTPANDRAAVGLWEALRLPSVQQVFIVGVPGSDPLWSVIERECRERNIELTYVGVPVVTSVDDLNLMMFPTITDNPAHVTMGHNGILVALALESQVPQTLAHALVSSRRPESNLPVDLLVLSSTQIFETQDNVVYVREREVVVLKITENAVVVTNGRLQTGATPVN